MTIQEGFLEFDFDELWQVIKYDEHAQHVARLQPIDSQAIDILASRQDTLVLLEIKDFRGHRIENKEKLNGPLAKTIAQKMRDSVCGIVGQRRLDGGFSVPPWSTCCSGLSGGQDVLAILFLQTDRNPSEKRRALLSTELKLLKQAMRWSGMRVLVVDLDTYATALTGVEVRSLVGAGGKV